MKMPITMDQQNYTDSINIVTLNRELVSNLQGKLTKKKITAMGIRKKI